MPWGITICIALALVTLAYLVARIIARCEFRDRDYSDADQHLADIINRGD